MFPSAIRASLHPCQIGHPDIVSSFGQYSNELNIDGIDFVKELEFSDYHEFDNSINLSVNMVKVIFCQEGKNVNMF